MGVRKVFILLMFSVIAFGQCRCDSDEAPKDIRKLHFEVLLPHCEYLDTRMQSYETSLARVTILLERLETRMENRFEAVADKLNASKTVLDEKINSMLQQVDEKVVKLESHIEDQIENKITVLKTLINDRYNSSNNMLQQMEDIVLKLEPHIEDRLENKITVLKTLIGDRYNSSNNMLKRVEEKVAKLESHIEDRLENKITVLKTLIDHRYNSSNSMLQRVEEKVGKLESHIEDRPEKKNNAMNTLIEDRFKSTNKVLQQLEERLVKLESRVEDRLEKSSSSITSAVNNQISTHSTHILDRIKQIESKTDAIDSRTTSTLSKINTRMEESGKALQSLMEKQAENIVANQTNFVENIFKQYSIALEVGWTPIQHRVGDTLNFFRDWNDYKNGFGNEQGEYWIGLEKMHQLTSRASYELLIVLEDFYGGITYAHYDDFVIGGEDEKYALKRLGSYSGTADYSLKEHEGMPFSTYDRDSNHHNKRNCASVLKLGGWWFTTSEHCMHSHLNGNLHTQLDVGKEIFVIWTYSRGAFYSLRSSKMLIRRKS